MPDLNEISNKLDELHNKIGKKDCLALIKEVLIPIAGVLLAIMGYIANHDANIRQKQEAEAARQRSTLNTSWRIIRMHLL